MAGEVQADPIIKEATDALRAGGEANDDKDADAITAANREWFVRAKETTGLEVTTAA